MPEMEVQKKYGKSTQKVRNQSRTEIAALYTGYPVYRAPYTGHPVYRAL